MNAWSDDSVTPPDATAPESTTGAAAAATALRRRRWPLITMVVALSLVVAGGVSVAVVEQLRKDVTLDVDGELVAVTTYAGTVDDVLAEEGVRVGANDEVTPAAGDELRDGAVVEVRYGRELTVEADGEEQDVWVAALDADEALAELATRDEQVRLLPSRSADRATLPIRLDAEQPVALVVGGEETVVDDGATTLSELFEAESVEIDADDRVHVDRIEAAEAGDPTVRVVVQVVDVKKVTQTKKIAHDTVTRTDPDRYRDQGSTVSREGKDGERTIVKRVTRVDGEVESREKVSNKVTTKPVDEIVVTGTKERPEPEPEPQPADSGSSSSSSSSSSSGSSSSGSSGSTSSSGGSAPAGVWAQLAQCESGGNPSTNTGNGYYGLYQFSLPTWQAVGGSGLPSDASAAEQTKRAQILQQRSGWGQWPHCASKLGLL
ncbi:transglycosylase family protein [Isoptericola sp. S6320L]|uniref:resuscitation-promoting factor n=1 Tax=Isoptericola sp. S6320L TaxID=2926411 RepID=UPI001FF396E5|nr:resuscitation-promoting factor [Isoptericola sp. S6320L]MCK0118106.1 transglycosylase family protein [Isoptericola sp. S6320L]